LSHTGPWSIRQRAAVRGRPAKRRSTLPTSVVGADITTRIPAFSAGRRALRIGELTIWCTWLRTPSPVGKWIWL
jgi:hypothetical protein